jgi:hypothetical protein
MEEEDSEYSKQKLEDSEYSKQKLEMHKTELEMRKTELEMRKENFKIMAALIAFGLVVAVIGFAIYENYNLEQKKLDLMRHQFDVQADQTNRSLQLQVANETMKAFEILMNSPLVDLLGAPKGAGNAAKDLALEIIRRFNVNVDCAQLWLCDNKDNTSPKPAPNSSMNECQCQNMPTNIPEIANNNRENLNFAKSYRSSPIPV